MFNAENSSLETTEQRGQLSQRWGGGEVVRAWEGRDGGQG